MRKLNCILLVDDDNDHNFLHRRLFNKMECAEKVQIVHNGIEGLDFLTTKTEGKYPNPEIIFLDINMPKMNGWQFLEKYKNLEEEVKAKVVLLMLTSSLNPDDEERAGTYKDVLGYNVKLLDKQLLTKILAEHFPEHR